MNSAALRRRFPRAAQGFLALNDDHGIDHRAGGAGSDADVERHCGPALEKNAAHQGGDPGKFLVRVTSVRKRLLDEDNLCEKFHVDCLRYAGIIPSDAPGTTRIETTQRSCGEGEEEKTVIQVFKL